MDKRFFLVLGMHRSGTSCLTGALERCGVYLGDVKRKGKYNKKGYFEIAEVYKIHDQILKLNGANWVNIPTDTITVHPHHEKQLNRFVKDLRMKSSAGLKDPRLLLLLDFWKELLDNNYQFVGTFRHPRAVAQSLFNRDKMPIEKGIALWRDYNSILVKEHQKNPFPIIHFDLSNPKDYRSHLIMMAKELGLKPSYWKLYLFITSKLEHHHFSDEEVPNSCKTLYDYLKSVSVQSLSSL